MNLYTSFIQSIAQFSDSTALQWEDGKISFREVLDWINISANEFNQRFPQKHQNVALLAPNTPNFIFGLFSILGNGHVVVPLNPLLNPEEMGALLEHAEPAVMLYDPLLEESAKKAVDFSRREVQLIPVPNLLQTETPDTSPRNPEVEADDLSMILYTSGTTGDPKGVMLTHRNILVNAGFFPSVIKFGPNTTVPLILPLFHTFALTVIVFGALMLGSRVLLFPQFQPQKILECVVQEKNVLLIAVPPMYHLMARFAPEGIDKQHNIIMAISGGGPLPVEVTRAFEKKFNFLIQEGYGLTETSPVVSLNPQERNKVGTIGIAFKGADVQIRSENGEILGTHEIGELCVKGDIVMKGYYKHPKATKEAFFEEEWLRTGDLARIDEEGYIQIVGRAKDVIVCGGENIYPREIEETLAKFPGVAEVAVVGKPHKLRTEVPSAFVVLAEEAKGKVTESQLRKHCREHLGEYKIPENFYFIDEMPKTATRKIQKEELKKTYFG